MDYGGLRIKAEFMIGQILETEKWMFFKHLRLNSMDMSKILRQRFHSYYKGGCKFFEADSSARSG
jgi:hypothetical protein